MQKTTSECNAPGSFFLVDDIGLDVHFVREWTKERSCRRWAVGKQHPTGVLHF